MKIKFIKGPLGSKELNNKAKDKLDFMKKALSRLNCTGCKNQTTVTAVAALGQRITLDWHYCCSEFEAIIQQEQARLAHGG